MEKIMKMFWRNCKWEFIETVAEWSYKESVYNIYKDTNKNWLNRYRKVLVNYWNVYNENNKLIKNKLWKD